MRYTLYFGPDVLHITMEGPFSFVDARCFRKMLSAIGNDDGERREVHLNLSRVSSVDTTAVSFLMRAHDHAKRVRRLLFFVKPRGQVLSLLNDAATVNKLWMIAD